MDCNEINQPDLLVYHIRQDSEAGKNRVFRCFYDQCFSYIASYFRKQIFPYWTVAENWEEELTNEAFEDGLLEFYQSLRDKGFEQYRQAAVKTVLTTFCKRKLFRFMRKLSGSKKNSGTMMPWDDEHDQTNTALPDYAIREQEEMKKHDEECRLEAMRRLPKRDANLLQWRKWKRQSNEEIAGQMDNIQPGTVTNEVYKSFKRLYVIYDNLRKNNR